ncbi:hypothetical protein F4820DRAFT_470723 [Hypoxylon rubiginosum]|uniref:Uncharacterized protein n=1 Tax=Hypoxylon rubiginosum TaxID=110542 RepID=A0ACB9ZDE2_9PEZI|nr:hypothetical protein F4820DRAFT_470723 [Hypoxylon rubiginosum]
MDFRNLRTFWWLRIKARKARVLRALETEDFTYLNLPDALRAHSTIPKQICRLGGISESVIDRLRDACIGACEASKKILASAKLDVEAANGEAHRGELVDKLGGIHNKAKQQAIDQVHKVYSAAELLINRFPGPELVPGHDLPEQATDLFLHAAYWIEYSFRGLVSGLKYISSKKDLLMEGDSKPLDTAGETCNHEVDAAISEIEKLFVATPEDYVII